MSRLAVMLLGLGLAFGVPVLTALRATPRWRFRIFVPWAIVPLIILLAVAASEIAAGKAGTADLGKLIYGVVLIGAFVALPWLIACGLGYATGAMLRGRAPSHLKTKEPLVPKLPLEDAAPIAYVPPPVDASAPTLSPPSGWRAAHVGPDHDDLLIDGLPVWTLPWSAESSATVMLVHPAHPGEVHKFAIYNINDETRATRFAAAELSNGVWGFYRWLVPADAVFGTSADGSLRFEHDLGPFEGGRYDAVAPTARLWDARTDALLFDGSAWASSRLMPQADGSLLLSLQHREQQTIFRIDPAAGKFRNLVAPTGDRSLAELAGAASTTRVECDDPNTKYFGRKIAPDGSLVVELVSVEWRNGYWVRSPRVIEIATGLVLLDLWGTDWDAAVSFPRSRTVKLSLRRYHYGGEAEVEIDAAGDRYVLFEKLSATMGPRRNLLAALEASSRAQAAEGKPRSVIGSSRVTARSWIVALLILVGTLALIALGTVLTLRFHKDDAVRKLEAIPPAPRTATR